MPDVPARGRAWLDRWRPILPILVAELITWIGFGALLPVMPIYFVDERGIDPSTLGLIVAAWPASRLVGEPIFGWLADRTSRTPLMVVGVAGAGIFAAAPLFVSGAVAFIVVRALSGLAAAAYDPAARGYLTDATADAERGEAFGLYGAVQMGGLLFGPAIGGLGAALTGGIEFAFLFAAAAAVLAAGWLGVSVRELPHRAPVKPTASAGTELPTEGPDVFGRPGRVGNGPTAAPTSLLNRLLVAAILLNIGGFMAGGTYEVVWSLFLGELGAGLDLIGLSFATFGLPVLLLSPLAGRAVDRRGAAGFMIVGALGTGVASVGYTFAPSALSTFPLVFGEGLAFALLQPALYAIVARGSPVGRSSTAQGLFGAAGTLGFIVASLAAGVLYESNIRAPFYLSAGAILLTLGLALLIGRQAIRRSLPGSRSAGAGVLPAT